jgi:hypothetical protein
LVLTGHRNQGHHLVKLEGTPIWLSGSLFDLICEMALARGRSQLGFVSCNRMAIQRLRCVLDSATGQQGLGARMIVTGSKSHYRLALDPGYISLDSTFDELPDNLLTPELVKGLRIRFDGG